MKELFTVLKEHNNSFMVELVNSSYKYCFQDEFESVLGEVDSIDVDECGTENVVRICLIDHSFHSSLSLALDKTHAKLLIKHFGFQVDGSNIQIGNETVVEQARLSDKLTVLVNDNGIAMKKLGYALYIFQSQTTKDHEQNYRHPRNPFCVIRPLTVDYTLIEVSDGKCWSVKERRFVENAIDEKEIGHVTPRAFLPF